MRRKTDMQHKHTIRFRNKDGVHETVEIEAASAGEAFAKCQKAHPDALMIQASRYGKYRDGEGWTHFEPPKIQREPRREPALPKPPKPQNKEGVFSFYDEVVK